MKILTLILSVGVLLSGCVTVKEAKRYAEICRSTGYAEGLTKSNEMWSKVVAGGDFWHDFWHKEYERCQNDFDELAKKKTETKFSNDVDREIVKQTVNEYMKENLKKFMEMK